MRTYIPLNALRAFEAAARHLSVSRAAEELCVTPTAISHQIRSLEGFLETSLFDRKNGKLALNPVTASALRELSEGFDKLEGALMSLTRRGQRRKLVVAASPSLSSLWLMPKLDRFLSVAPDVDLSLCTAISDSDFSEGPFDVAIAATGDVPGRRSDYLMDERIYPVCAPRLLPPGLAPERALYDAALIHDDKASEHFPTWRRYFEATRREPRDVSGGLRFNQSSLAMDAAERGFGLLLARSRLIADALADKRLVLLSDRAHPISYRYYALRPRGVESRLATQFLEWLAAEIEAEDAAWTFDAAASVAQRVGVAVGPEKRRRVADVDGRCEERLVGQKRRRVGAVLACEGHPDRRTQIFDIGDAAAKAGSVVS